MSSDFLAAKEFDKLAHTSVLADFISTVAEVGTYIAIGAAASALTVCTFGAGGALVATLVVGAASAGVGDHISDAANSFGNSVAEFFGCGESFDGTIMSGSDNVHTKSQRAARAAGKIPNSVLLAQLEQEAFDALPPTQQAVMQLMAASSQALAEPEMGPPPPPPPDYPSEEENWFKSFITPTVAKKDPKAKPMPGDIITCDKTHVFMGDGLYLAEGSKSVLINSQPASRNGDRSTCEAVIKHEQPDRQVRIGGSTAVVRDIKSGKSPWVTGVEAAIAIISLRGIVKAGFKCLAKTVPCMLANMAAESGAVYAASASMATFTNQPIHLPTGTKVLAGNEDLDFVISGRQPIVWQRIYTSRNTLTGMLGEGWRLGVEISLELEIVNGEEQIHYYDVTGRKLSLGMLAEKTSIFYVDEGFTLYRLSATKFLMMTTTGDGYIFTPVNGSYPHLKLVETFDSHGNPLYYHYDEHSRLIAIDDGTANWGIDLSYHIESERVMSIHQRSAEAESALKLVDYQYDKQGQLIEVKDADDITTRLFTYHFEHKKMRSHQTSLGLIATYDWQWMNEEWYAVKHQLIDDQTLLESIELHYDLTLQTVTLHEQGVGTSTRRWNDFHLVTEYTNALGEIWQFEWDKNKNITRAVSPTGQVDQFKYDERGNRTQYINALGEITLTDWDREFALPTVEVLPSGATWQYQYNERCDLVAVEDPHSEVTRYVYNHQGDCLAIIDAKGNRTEFHYDEYGQLMRQHDCSGHMTRFFYQPTGQIKTVIDPEGGTTGYEFTPAGRIKRVVLPDNRLQTYFYNSQGVCHRITAPDGSETRWVFNARGNITQVIKPDGNRISYDHDLLGRVIRLRNETNETYHFQYDAVGRLLEETDLIGQRKRYEYNPSGELIRYVAIPALDNYGSEPISQDFERDALGRMVAHHTDEQSIVYKYGPKRLDILRYTRSAWHEAQNSGQEAEPIDTLAFEYDLFGQRIAEHNHGGTFTHQYDLLGNLMRTGLPDGAGFEHHYYGSGHLLESQFTRGETRQLIAEYTRDKLHRETQRTQGALSQRTHYDPLGRITQKAIRRLDAHISHQALLDKRFEYDQKDELLRKHITHNNPAEPTQWGESKTEFYHYDALGHCISRLGDPFMGEAYYDYDAKGNKLDQYERIQPRNQLSLFNGKHYEYDGFGRLRCIRHVGKPEKKFTYDSQHQLIYAEIEGSEPCTAEYDYDALGRRIQKRITYHAPKHRNETEEKVTVSHFYWDGLRLAGESRADRPENRRWYAYNEGSYEPIAFIDYWDIVKRDEIYYYHTNINGAPEELTAEDGQYAWKGHFTLWGKSYRVEQPISTLYGQPLRFQGQYFDQETGLHYNTFRYYDPETGCFTQQDPIGLAGGINLYQYSPNPISWIDPLGWINAPATLPNTPGVYIITAGNQSYVGSSGIGKQGMYGRVSDINHKEAQKLLELSNVKVQFVPVDLGTAKTRSDRNNILRYYEQREYDKEFAKGRHMKNDKAKRIQAEAKRQHAENLIKEHGASAGARRRTCKR